MGRVVRPRTAANAELVAGDAGGADGNGSGDSYLERLVKYIPAETIAVYTLIDKMVLDRAGNGSPDSTAETVGVVIFFVGLVGTFAYIWKLRQPGRPWGLHAGLATGAFACWAYTLGGSIFVFNNLYDTLVAAIAAPLFTYIAAWFEPRPA